MRKALPLTGGLRNLHKMTKITELYEGYKRLRRRRPVVLVGAGLLFMAIFACRLLIDDPSALVANFYAIPIALVAAELGLRAGLGAAAIAVGLVFAWGGASFAQSLTRLGLIDEYRLVLHPVAIGQGLPLFKGLTSPLHLNLVEAQTYSSGLTLLVYQPA